jgi:hypothetical protein
MLIVVVFWAGFKKVDTSGFILVQYKLTGDIRATGS